MLIEKNPPKILLVEDDASLSEWIITYLCEHGYQVRHLACGSEVVASVQQETPDLIILDILLPGVTGFVISKELRRFHKLPILMLTACGEEANEVLGFEVGANDFLVKPFRPRVLLARIQALLRREPVDSAGHLSFGYLRIVRDAKAAFYKDAPVPLTAHEFDVLWVLAENAGEVVSREALVVQLRGIEYDGFDRSIDIRISRLRKKLHDNPDNPQRIKTVWAKGYLFAPNAWT